MQTCDKIVYKTETLLIVEFKSFCVGKRCGDYYMFDYESDNSENEEDVLELEAKSESTISKDPLGTDKEKLPIGPLQVYKNSAVPNL